MSKFGRSWFWSGNLVFSFGYVEVEMRYLGRNTETVVGEFWCKDIGEGVFSIGKVLKNID